MVFNIIHAWVLEIVPILILTQYFGFDERAIWWTIAGAVSISSVAFYMYYRRGAWLHARV
jgi:Na+-driven multidrug efflux pump